MTVEELLRPRYKVIADYPGCSFEVGEILVPNDEGELHSKTAGYSWTVTRILEKDVKKYPHLVKKLEWWEERKPEDMPMYLRSISASLQMVIGGIYKVKKYHKDVGKYGVFIEGKDFSRLIETLLPATEKEYNDYLTHA